ncbi:MAG: S8 family serine peptidase [Cypionkella sp.]
MPGTGLLVKVSGNAQGFATAADKAFGAAVDGVTPILEMPATRAGMGVAAAPGATWFRIDQGSTKENLWDAAHAALASGQGIAAKGRIAVVEPDHEQRWFPAEPEGAGIAMAAADRCIFHDQDPTGGKAVSHAAARDWNQQSGFSEFAAARARLGADWDQKLAQIIVAHLDTGYDPRHVTLPAHLDLLLQRNFIDAGFPNDASDRTPDGASTTRNRGHGTATLALLAGNRLDGSAPGWPGFSGYVGGAPAAHVIPIRIADWVVRFWTGTMVQGFDHARRNKADVLSMSMGGLTSAALVDAVNLAYDSGMVIVTAAGNNYAGNQATPRSVVFPARYRRVLAACGVMANGQSYSGLASGTMQGSFGPSSKMDTAIGAFTPNVAWAAIGCGNVVNMDGSGTSAATPQVAAAAALWLAHHRDAVMAYPEPWMRVEAVRHALFNAAAKSTDRMSPSETFEKIGNGVLKADQALAMQPVDKSMLKRLAPAQASFGWIDILFGGGVSVAAPTARDRMLALELTQMAQRKGEVDAAIGDNDLPADQISAAARQRYLEAALDAGAPSAPLKAQLERWLSRKQTPSGQPVTPAPVPTMRRKIKELPPPARRLRVYALDPSAAKSLDYVAINQTTLAIRWEENLQPGPVGEYIEVVDVDPASNRVYDPVDLNAQRLLAQDGHTPSEGNPQFHQQMVYAVAMTTIENFEQALGRKALWAPHRKVTRNSDGTDKFETFEVPRLRIYPHALRTDNAYYSPDKTALLFGYFQSASQVGDATAPGSTVFSCLSSDIVAHEMSHALLDGLHRRMQEVSNPDVPAFHEAFADIVALFQHFNIGELVRFQVAQAQGNLNAAELLGGLARQFGEGTGRRGPLRDYLANGSRTLDYATTTEPHARAEILVAAVYEAFLRIVGLRTADLIRIATNGSGLLPPGALHPDLVNRIAMETTRTARHVLRMCIRALDYCPAVDITFGEYLRALITTDIDTVAEDGHHYRVAFMESFRKFGILPRDVRTISEETLRWGTFPDPEPRWLGDMLDGFDFGWDRMLDRSEIFDLNEQNRKVMYFKLKDIFKKEPDLLASFGLLDAVAKYNEHFEVIRPGKPGKTTFDVFGVRPARRLAPDGSARVEVVATILQRRAMELEPGNPAAGHFWFRGGATLVIDPRAGHREIRYSIIKNSGSTTRAERQRQTAQAGASTSLRALYFGDAAGEPFAMLHSHDGEG